MALHINGKRVKPATRRDLEKELTQLMRYRDNLTHWLSIEEYEMNRRTFKIKLEQTIARIEEIQSAQAFWHGAR